MKTMYKPSEAARLADVTVRTLHHYDRTGLLRPSGRTSSGYRLYSEADLVRLQHIGVLKFLGLKLSEIRDLLRKAPTDIREALQLHRRLLEERQRQIGRAVRVIELAESRGYDLDSLIRSMEVLRMSERKGWMMEYYSPDAQEKIRANQQRFTPEMQAETQRKWQELIAEVEDAATNEDPGSPRARELASRWQALIRGFTMDDPEIKAGLQKLYADKKNWPSEFKSPCSEAAGAFIHKAMELLKVSG